MSTRFCLFHCTTRCSTCCHARAAWRCLSRPWTAYMVKTYVCGAIVAYLVFDMEFAFSYRFQSDHSLCQVLITGMQWHRPKKNAKIAMPWPANAINVWRWEIHWLYDTVSVFPVKMCIIMCPFEGPNGHLRQGQQWNEVSSGHDGGNDHGVLGTSLRKVASDHDKAWLKIANMWDLPLSATATDESVQCSRLSPNCLLKMVTGHFVCWLLGCLHHVYLHIRTSSPSNFRALWSWDTPQTQQAPLYARCAEETFILRGSLRKWHPVRTRIKCLRGHLV